MGDDQGRRPKHTGDKNEDYILEDIVGGNGWWQWRTTIALFPLIWAGGIPLFLSVFAAYTPPHRCLVEQCDGPEAENVFNASYLRWAVPREHHSDNFLKRADDFDPCHKFASVSDSCSAEGFNPDAETETCNAGYVYDRSQMTETLSTTLNLVCDEEHKRRLLGSTLMMGLLIGSLIGGHIGDRFGRRNSLFLGVLISGPAVIIGGSIPNYYAYLILRLVSCTCLPIIWISSHTYGLEYFSPCYRKLIICIKDIPLAAYGLVLLVHYNRDWQSLHWYSGIVCLVGLPIFFFIPESPRWLAVNDRADEAEKVFLAIAKTNGREVSDSQRKEIKGILEKIEDKSEDSLNPKDMFQRPHIIKTFVLLLNWVCVCVGYYALTLSATKLNGDIVINYLLTTIADTPVFILMYFVLDGVGRRWTLAISQGILGLACITLAFLPKYMNEAILVAFITGRTASGIGFMLVWLVTAELYPTNLRAQALGFCSMVSRVFGLTAPFVTKLAVYWTPLPMLLLGVPTLVAASLAPMLHETSRQHLPSNMMEADQMEKADDGEKEANGKDNLAMDMSVF